MQRLLSSQETQPKASPTTIRTAYIRTILDSEVKYYEHDWSNLTTWLWFWVGQEVPKDPFQNDDRGQSQSPPDIHHHYILLHRNAADAFVLEWLLRNSEPEGWRLARDNFTVYLSRRQMNEPANKLLLHHLGSMRVALPQSTEYASGDICDTAMFSKSDYVLETSLVRGAGCATTFDTLFRNSMRHGCPQQYRTEEKSSAYYANRLKGRMGHTQRYCGYPHGKSEAWKQEHEKEWKSYKCPSCGKRCKRSKGCKSTGEFWTKDEGTWVDIAVASAARPPEFEKEWRALSVEDVINNHGLDATVAERLKHWKWRSIDTFSGDK
ncbi:uncharacterized protein NECHADRAFT_55774 [Fusarium vanettenii 77-13-4]|uniref:Uncharacterized protein n=1 Tax=Fusarium vanettenii (strain ATCC MYA-4622 / CBS 123669 / FGSC 9596 / NRRL 45880 / 77-13-4) TaxID=660122 RepID=C7ZN31_FUSV7|nr:uncharacterized protein NECHADRAFT_55774 [Fusarium vanettenii 77-13-4]EEU34584.1 hypothetical protein NECHADRAFT_55774 [Fusarium vanettenii 77-13-4]